MNDLKIAVAGKGGVGKTFISGTLARLLAREGYNVLAVDADPNVNTASSLGVPSEIAEKIIPLSENKRLIEEKTGVPPNKFSTKVFRLTPNVSDIVEKFGVIGPDGVQLLVMGTVNDGGAGCMCPSNALLRVLVQHLLIQRKDILVMDMVAGLEHLGRGTARRMDTMLAVIEPRMKSVETVKRVIKLAKEIEVREVLAVGNKIRSERERLFIEEKMRAIGVEIAAYVPYDEAVVEADMEGIAPIDRDDSSPAISALFKLKECLKTRYSF
ncbi:cobalamin biosynthesis protein CobN [Candidatus Bathyarchaeota archaeon]|jgi:CO dehydrogenase maturation factor|nr:cobalamin biosynthesis protein CobN [Candidatus Bathyarchaeota archaeon]MDP6048078.1 AAA family ATPase [Candidatus Bathyarchaeota archaeon]